VQERTVCILQTSGANFLPFPSTSFCNTVALKPVSITYLQACMRQSASTCGTYRLQGTLSTTEKQERAVTYH
jgi:hypothetical protein